MDALLQTVVTRPYVVTFLIAFLAIGWLNRGIWRTLALLGIGYAIAFASEWSSIRYGIPYGDYRYLYTAMPGELILAGVPVWDSVSYAFIAYAAYETACYLEWRHPVPGGAFLMMWADVVIDPVALRGERWFLGQVFEYTTDGQYFGVPLSNFAGWFVVGLAILGLWAPVARRLPGPTHAARAPLLGPLFYYGIVGFIVAVAIAIGETGFVAVSLCLHAPVVVAVGRRARRQQLETERRSTS